MDQTESTEPLELDEVVKAENPEPQLRQIIGKIRTTWTPEGMKLKPLSSEGFVNTLLLATHNDNPSDGVVIRLYSDAFGSFLNRKREFAAMKVFNERGLTPRIYCLFKNGMCMEYLQGRTHSWDELTKDGLKDMKVIRAAAREQARYHSKKTSDIGRTKFGDIFSWDEGMVYMQRNVVDNWPETTGDEAADQILKEYPTKDEWLRLATLIMEDLRDSGAKMAMCHLDTHPCNMFYQEKEDRVIYFDYELSAYHFTAVDMARFLTFSANGLFVDLNDERRHPDTVRTEFFRAYLEEQKLLGDFDGDITDGDIRRLSVLADKASLIDILFDSAMSMILAQQPTLFPTFSKKDFAEFAYQEYEWVIKHKDEYLAKKVEK